MTTLEDILDKYLYQSSSTAERGTKFERLVQAFLKKDTQWGALYDEVWTWPQWPEHHGHDTGIDLIARERDTGHLVAVQCKFYDPSTTIQKQHIDSFLSESGKHPFTGRLVVTTTDKWGPNAEQAIRNQQIPVQRIGLTDLLDSSIDWSLFDVKAPDELKVKARKELMAHQRTALDKVLAGLAGADRGKLIMACGTGKTFASLRIAEAMVPLGGSVLFLVPSIALLSQALKEWSIEAQHSLRTFAVCSDSKAGVVEEDITTVDLPIPPTTSAARLAAAAADGKGAGRLTVVFSTYQSIDVVAQAQRQGLAGFDLVICDEAHRTTGVRLAGQEADESAFVRVHNADYLKATKRLYMTATPRIYDDTSKAKAGQAQAVLASMDDEKLYGAELYRLGFGEAVTRNLLTDYKVLVLAVDEGTISRTMQDSLTDPANSELKLDDVAKIVGVWNGLAKRGHAEHDFATDPEPMRRAVAFSRSIKDSQRFTEKFSAIVADYQRVTGLRDEAADDPDAGPLLVADVEHVDGGDNMVRRNHLLTWLKDDTDGQCRILSNAKCLSEGVDVPALDAVLFLNPRKSQVDVVQSVGRVMRRAPGKKYGYIILPIVVPAGMKPEDALRDNERYRVVWEVLQALRAHDERFDAMVNKIELNKGRDDRINVIGVGGREPDEHSDGPTTDTNANKATQGWFDLSALGDFRSALYVKIVQKVGSRRYWEDWARDVATIADKHRLRLVSLLEDGHAAQHFEDFHAALRANLNDSISRNDAIDMLSQHLITAPIFSALFADYDFATHNPVSQVMDHMLRALEGTNLQAETAELDAFYASVRQRVAGIDNAAGRQTIIKDLYERFFKLAFPRAADQLGIVYTPVEIVDFIIRSVDHLLRTEFGASLSDEGVHVLDPFTGTGTFIVRLLQSGLINAHDLARKYASELHANEIMLLAYYIAAINIESTYHDVLREALDYQPFDGIVLTDTFQMHEGGDLDDGTVFTTNTDRVIAQRALDIRVIIGNPPYSVGQTSGNDNAANLKYPTLDAAIEHTYAARSSAGLKRNLYDSYVRAIRWASDRVGEEGVVGFVTNGGFIDANSSDGLRKALGDEFATIYVYNLRGNARTSGEQRRKERGNVFGGGARTTVAITFLVKHRNHRGTATVRYRDIGDYLTQEDKLRIVDESMIDSLAWSEITPNDAGDWINQRSGAFDSFMPMAGPQGVFSALGPGVSTNRDAWVYSFSKESLAEAVERTAAAYASALAERLRLMAPAASVIQALAAQNSRDISWSSNLADRFQKGQALPRGDRPLRKAAYRPFQRQWLCVAPGLIDRLGSIGASLTSVPNETPTIAVTGVSANDPFGALATSLVPNLHFMNSGSIFARWVYEKAESDSTAQGAFDFEDAQVVNGYRRIDNITDVTLNRYRTWYGSDVTKDVVFAFIYGFLHSPDYRDRFAADLKRSLPRIPRIEADDFAAFRNAGQTLLDLHIGYEAVDPYPLTITGDQPSGPGSADRYEWFRVDKLRWGGKGKAVDKSTIVYNPHVMVSGIPADAHRYMLGSRSALEWILDRYQVKTDAASGIVNDPNDWSREVGNPRYILDLIGKVTTVSVETMKIVDALPPLRIVDEAEELPKERAL